MNPMIKKLLTEDLDNLVRRIEQMEKELLFLNGVLGSLLWLSRTQTLQVLNVSETTLHGITKKGLIAYRKEGRRILYQMESIRDYMLSRRMSSKAEDAKLFAENMEHFKVWTAREAEKRRKELYKNFR